MKKNNKNNRKNLVFVAMVLLLGVVLFMGGSTYAKYITEKDVISEQATVAKWGYVITENTTNFFGTDYTKANGTTATVVADDGASVESSTTSNVVAPGTSGSMTLSIIGQAEVLSKITFTVTGNNAAANAGAIQLTEANGGSVQYEPIKWTVTANDGNTAVLGTLPTNATLAQLETWLEGLNDDFATINPNTNININITISWAWAFEGNNNYDTMLGDLAAGKTSHYANAPVGTTTMYFNLKVAVEQIQDVPANQG